MNLLSLLPVPSFPLIGIATVVAFVAGAGVSWKVVSDHYEAKEAQKLEQVLQAMQEEVKRGNEIAERTEAKVGKIRVINRTINNEVQREVTEKTIYRDCVIPPSGLQLWNAANKGAASTPKLDAGVPGSSGGAVGRVGGVTPEPRRSGGAVP